MPADLYNNFGDEDLAAIAAYVGQLPPVDRAIPPSELRVVGRAMVAAGIVGGFSAEAIDHRRPHVQPPAPAVTPEYGSYLVTVGACKGCHGPNLSGGPEPGAPPDAKPPANLTPAGIGHYTEADFIRALREGVRPGGVPIDSQMPWRLTREMSDDEIRAIYQYLRTVPARTYGGR